MSLEGISLCFSFFFSFVCCSSFFFAFICFFRCSPHSPSARATTPIYWKHGVFQSDPVCTDPIENFPKEASIGGFPSRAGHFRAEHSTGNW